MRKSPQGKRSYQQLYRRIEQWLKKHAPEYWDDELTRTELFNLYLTTLGVRKAFMTALGDKTERFARDFGLVAKRGPYFDIVGKDFTFLVNPKHADELEPLFQKLKQTYSPSDRVMRAREKQRSRTIGKILGYQCLGQNVTKETVYFLQFKVADKKHQQPDTFLFGYLCNLERHKLPINAALALVQETEPLLAPLGYQLEFTVGKYW